MASIRRLSEGRWQITWLEGYVIGPDGQRRQRKRSEIVYGTRHDADVRAGEIEKARIPASKLRNPYERTFGRVIAEWLERRRDEVDPETWRHYEQSLRLYALPALQNVPAVRLRPEDIERLYASLPTSKARKLHAPLRQILRWCLRERWLNWDVAAFIEPPKWRPKKRMPIPAHHAAAILAAFRAKPELRRWLAAVGLAYATGLRIGELFGLRWEDVDWSHRVIWVSQALKRPGKKPQFGDPKDDEARPIPVSRETLALLRWHRLRQKAERQRWEEDHGLVFCATDGSPADFGNFYRRVWHPTLGGLGLPRYVPHQLRHARATELLGGIDPVPLATVAKYLGHADPTTTERHYLHAVSADDILAAQKAGRLLASALRAGRNQDGQNGEAARGSRVGSRVAG